MNAKRICLRSVSWHVAWLTAEVAMEEISGRESTRPREQMRHLLEQVLAEGTGSIVRDMQSRQQIPDEVLQAGD